MVTALPETAIRAQPAVTAAFLTALTATLGALFIGKVLGLMPCTLCRYQRIAMFPLVALSGVGSGATT